MFYVIQNYFLKFWVCQNVNHFLIPFPCPYDISTRNGNSKNTYRSHAVLWGESTPNDISETSSIHVKVSHIYVNTLLNATSLSFILLFSFRVLGITKFVVSRKKGRGKLGM